MKTTTKELDNYESEITVEYEAADLEKAKKQAAQKLSERVSIPGFRKGKKIPPQIIEANLGKGAILEEAADILIRKAADELIRNENVIPVTQMKHNIITCEDGQPFTFTLTFTPYPEVTLGEYKNLNVPKTVEPVTDEEVEEQLAHLRNHHATMLDADSDAAVQTGDFITLDFTGYTPSKSESIRLTVGENTLPAEVESKLEGLKIGDAIDVPAADAFYHVKVTSIGAEKPASAIAAKRAAKATIKAGDTIGVDYTRYETFEGGTGTDFPLEIGSHRFIDNFEEQLVGAKAGDEVNVNVTFPEDYSVKDLADKPAIFHCTVRSIKHKQLPPLDDEFAKKVSKFETLAEFTADVKKNMADAAERRATDKQLDDLIHLAADNMTVDIPPVMIESKIDQLISELELNLQQRGMTVAQYMSVSGTDMDALRDSYKDAATFAVRTDILLDEIAKTENIAADNQELNIELQYMAAMYRTTPKQIYKVLQENNQISALYTNVLHRKVTRFIFDNMAKSDEPAGDTDTGTAAADSDTSKD